MMDSSLAAARLAALVLCDPATGELRKPGDAALERLGAAGGRDVAERAWRVLGGCGPGERAGRNVDAELIDVAGSARGPEEALLYLYSWYQVLWTRAGGPEGALNSSYAASSIAGANRLWRVTFKISSIQDMIANSRKTSDLWAASYLGSILAWGTARPFIERYGPSSVLSPFIGANPLYVHYAYGRLRGGELEGMMRRLASGLVGIDPESEIPGSALLPAKMDLLIPDCGMDEDEVWKEVEDNYRNTWRTLYSALRNGWGPGFRKIEEMEGLLDEAAGWPPFPLERIDARCVSPEDLVKGADHEGRLGTWQRIWVDYGYGISGAALRATDGLYGGNRSYRFCTACGINVAAVEHAERGEKGEPLCPYCAAKRALPSGLGAILGALGFHAPAREGPHWPSTTTLAAAEALLRRYGEGEGGDLRARLIDDENRAAREAGDVEEVLGELSEARTHYYILRGDTDNAGLLFRENSGLANYVGVSRDFALMALAALRIMERAGGFVVYSGGDDLAALFPNVDREGVPLVADALGKLMEPCFGGEGGMVGEGDYAVPYRIHGKHCRSYSVLAAHYSDPLSVAWRMSGDLLELKDRFRSCANCGCGTPKDNPPWIGKNAVLIFRGSGHVASLHEMECGAALLPAVREIWSGGGALPTLLRLRGSGLAKGLAHDALREIDEYGREEDGSAEWTRVSWGILEMIVRRSEQRGGAASMALDALKPLRDSRVALKPSRDKDSRIEPVEDDRAPCGAGGRCGYVSWEALRALSHLR